VLVFLNNDMLVEPDFLGPLLKHFDDPTVFAATARIEMAPTQVAGGLVRETGLVRTQFEDGFFVLRHDEPISEEPVPVLYAGGGSSAMRRDRFLQLGAFDRLFRPFYFEDLDVSYRAQKMGWRVVFEPKSRMVHQHRQTNSPRNFPGGYVDRMFGKNSLLFTWKVLTDRGLLGAHFRALWRKLMHPRDDPRLGACFLRATAQLPELLVKRRRARAGLALSDGEVIETGAGAPAEEAADGGPLPYGSTGTGKRVLVIGFAPLPFEREQRVGALCFRTWHVTQALLAAGHEVTLVGCRMSAAYRDESRRPAVLRFTGSSFTYYSAAPGVFEAGALLQSVCDRCRPEAIVAVHAFGGWAASRLASDAPLWADLNGYAMTEAQARAAVAGDEGAVAEAWERERAALARADAFSVVSMRQKYAVIGELAAVGRLTGRNYGEDAVHYMPNAIENEPYRHSEKVLRGDLIGAADFAVLWAGGYNTWTDVDTLFDGVVGAMREEPRVKFVSLGGAMPGRDEETFYRFRRKAEESEFASRFVFVGWVPTERVPNYYFECDAGINIDRFSYEMLIGCRYRILDMLRGGLPVITTLGTEISEIVRDEELGVTFAPGDAEGLTQAILTLAADEPRRQRCAERGREYVFEHRVVEEVMKPLQRWAKEPKASPDRLTSMRDPATGAGRVTAHREEGGGRGGLRHLVGALGGKLVDLLFKAFVRRRRTEPWGLDPGEPPQRALVVRAGSLELTQEVIARMRGRYPVVEVSVLVASALAEETKYEVSAPVISTSGEAASGYRVSRGLVGELRRRDFDTVVVAGEGSRRAELAALLSGAERRVEVRDDGAAHVFWFAVYKPLALAPMLVVSALEKAVMSLLVGLVWGSLAMEGRLWKLRPRRASAAEGGR
jgi:glycosyltransferase involved in cell wall biosynthesis